jgi:uncharacterized membrane protein
VITVLALGWLVSLLNAYFGPNTAIGHLLISLGGGIGVSAAPYVAGILLLMLAVYVLGLVVESRIGPWMTNAFEGTIAHIPVVSRLYDLTKRFTSILDNKAEGNLAAMSPVWCFFGGEPGAAVLALLPSSEAIRIGSHAYVGVLIPSAPVPVGGALIYVPSSWIKPAEGGVDGLMSVYLSMGVTPPATNPPPRPSLPLT